MIELGVEQKKPIVIYQDNKSTIHMVNDGIKFRRAKHLMNKGNFVKECIDSGIIQTEYLRTEDMIADMETKPSSRKQLEKFCRKLNLKTVKTSA